MKLRSIFNMSKSNQTTTTPLIKDAYTDTHLQHLLTLLQLSDSATPNLPTDAARFKYAKEYTKATFAKTFKVRLIKQ